jgi:hypothetical protein
MFIFLMKLQKNIVSIFVEKTLSSAINSYKLFNEIVITKFLMLILKKIENH